MIENILTKTLNQMPFYFSSNAFTKKAMANGLPKNFVHNAECNRFLYANCNRHGRRQWSKKLEVKEKPTEILHQDNSKLLNEENAIALLKSLGYKILKPKTEFVEL